MKNEYENISLFFVQMIFIPTKGNPIFVKEYRKWKNFYKNIETIIGCQNCEALLVDINRNDFKLSMFVDQLGRFKRLEFNQKASKIIGYRIYGPALLLDDYLQLNIEDYGVIISSAEKCHRF